MVQQAAVAVRRRPQLVDEVGEQPHVIGVDPGELLQAFEVIAMVREAVVIHRHAELRVRAPSQLPAQHERRDARDVGPECQPLEIKHQLDVIGEVGGNADRPLRH